MVTEKDTKTVIPLSFDYEFVRDYDATVGWLINNPTKLDSEGNQIFLASQVKSALPDKHFISYCSGNKATFSFDVGLTTEELQTLTTVVDLHQSLTGTAETEYTIFRKKPAATRGNKK